MKDDEYDKVSNLNRPGVFRLKVGVGKETFQSLFEGLPAKPGLGGFRERGIDFTELNKLLPHPMYGSLYWISILNPSSVLNPSTDTFHQITPYLLEANHNAAHKK